MNQIKEFDLSRIGLLIKKEIFYQKRAPWIIVGAVFVFLLLINVLMASENPGPNDMPANQVIFYVIIMFILGTVFTSASFNELNDKSRAHHYLSVPASTLEKLLSKWLITGLLFVIAFNVFYFIYSLISNIVIQGFFDMSAGVWNPFEQRVELDGWTPWFFSQLYLTLHTVYLAGAVYFRKFSYFKTVIAQAFISLTVLGLIAAVSSLMFMGIWGEDGIVSMQVDDQFNEIIDSVIPNLAKILIWFIFPLWMLVYSFYKLKETEV